MEGGSGTRRRPIGQDYAAAKDAEVGKVSASCDGRWPIMEFEMRQGESITGIGLKVQDLRLDDDTIMISTLNPEP